MLVQALATARLTRLATEDEITAPLRHWVFRTTGEDSRWSYLVECPWCMSIYAAGVVQIAERTRPGRFLNRVLALSQAGTMISVRGEPV